MEPTTLGHYRLDERIGEGGMGEVFRAFDTRLNRPVAVKVMRARRRGDRVVKGFLREARAASALNHPNIVIIHEIGETPAGDHYIVQELIQGRTLRSTLKTSPGPAALDTLVEVGSQIARALGAAHAGGVVHRDIKPENIMIRADGFVKVLDFGLAFHTGDEETVDLATRTHVEVNALPGTFTGTPSYMAPESVNGEMAGTAGDVFALGVVLYEMAAGRRPFGGLTPASVVASIVSDEPVPLGRVNRGIPRGVRRAGHGDAPEGAGAAAVGEGGRARAGRDPRERSRGGGCAGGRPADHRRPRIAARAVDARVCASEAGAQPDRRPDRRAGHRQDQPGRGLSARSWWGGANGRRSRAAAARKAWPAPRPICRSSTCSTRCCTATTGRRWRR